MGNKYRLVEKKITSDIHSQLQTNVPFLRNFPSLPSLFQAVWVWFLSECCPPVVGQSVDINSLFEDSPIKTRNPGFPDLSNMVTYLYFECELLIRCFCRKISLLVFIFLSCIFTWLISKTIFIKYLEEN